ncbi:MAG: GNAT family N-acetyltransferase [Coriobacteriia bacterium]|nr:GNAT family N-acetyltransferase [Coriobacteriia bacterium]
MSDDQLFGPEPLGPYHDVSRFDCGIDSLNEFLIKRALSDQQADKSRTYVVARQNRVVGYFSVAAASIEPQGASARAAKGQGAQAIPGILIGRLSVDRGEQGRGIGEALLIEALRKAAAAAETIGARVVLVNAIHETVTAFYLRYGFEASPTDPLHLMVLMKDVRKTLG